MTEPSFYYIVNEMLLSVNAEKLVHSVEFRAPEESLPECKENAEQFYYSKRKRIEYWIMLGTYKLESYQTFEMNVTLVEIRDGIKSEYILKSIIKNIPPNNLTYEQSVLLTYPANVDSWYQLTSRKVYEKPIEPIHASKAYEKPNEPILPVPVEEKPLVQTVERKRFSWFKRLFRNTICNIVIFGTALLVHLAEIHGCRIAHWLQQTC